MPASKLQPVVLEDRRILFRNFAGEEGRFNAKGQRNFNVLLTQDEADAMAADGWNVKYLQPREEGEPPQPRLEVSVHFGKNPPRVVLITSKGKTPLDESMISLLDWAEIEGVDMIIRPYEWEVNGRTGVKAYLKSIYVSIREDELEKKYMDVPDSAAGAMMMAHEEPEEGSPPWEN
jgi:hypothetical protein